MDFYEESEHNNQSKVHYVGTTNTHFTIYALYSVCNNYCMWLNLELVFVETSGIYCTMMVLMMVLIIVAVLYTHFKNCYDSKSHRICTNIRNCDLK